jgi:RNA polymerase sigma-70 factor (ECF subfamily)
MDPTMSDAQERDEWLMAQVAGGARPPLETLVRRYATPLLSFIHHIVRDRHRSEELFQEVFLTVWLKRHQYQSPRPFKPWLYAIALNRCRLEFRKPFTDEVSMEGAILVLSGEPSPADSVVAAETAHLVAAAVRRLPPQQQMVVVLRVWQGLSYAEIAETLGRTEGTVRANMHHALAALRLQLEPQLQ